MSEQKDNVESELPESQKADILEENASKAKKPIAENSSKKDVVYEDLKLFVTGLDLVITEDHLKDYFKKFGDITAVEIKNTVNPKKTLKYGFVSFSSKEPIESVLSMESHIIKEIEVKVKQAIVRPNLKKISIKGLDSNITETALRTHFEKYGKIESIEYPNAVTKFKAIITFSEDSMAGEASKIKEQEIGSKKCSVFKGFKADSKPQKKKAKAINQNSAQRGRGNQKSYGSGRGQFDAQNRGNTGTQNRGQFFRQKPIVNNYKRNFNNNYNYQQNHYSPFENNGYGYMKSGFSKIGRPPNFPCENGYGPNYRSGYNDFKFGGYNTPPFGEYTGGYSDNQSGKYQESLRFGHSARYEQQPGGYGGFHSGGHYSHPSSGYNQQSGGYNHQSGGYNQHSGGYNNHESLRYRQSSGYEQRAGAYGDYKSKGLYSNSQPGYHQQSGGYGNRQSGGYGASQSRYFGKDLNGGYGHNRGGFGRGRGLQPFNY